MKLTIRNRQIHDIPVLEIVPEALAAAPLPLIIFYHGWRNNKELMLTQARRLAAKQFRVILPDAMNHGQRKVAELSSVPGMTFWSSIQYNIIEFNVIVTYFNERNWILDERIGIGGYSMGGITTAALLSQHPEIKVATSIMGTPSPSAYIQLIHHSARQRKMTIPTDLRRLLSWVPQFDLSLQPEKMANRPILFWHGTKDPKIPYQQARDFYLENEGQPYSQKTQFLTGQDEGHLVTIELMDTIAEYFENHL